MRGTVVVTLGESLIHLPGERAYNELLDLDKDEVCEQLWGEIEWGDVIPGRGYGLQATQTGFTIDGNLLLVDEPRLREVLDEYSDYEYTVSVTPHESAI